MANNYVEREAKKFAMRSEAFGMTAKEIATNLNELFDGTFFAVGKDVMMQPDNDSNYTPATLIHRCK